MRRLPPDNRRPFRKQHRQLRIDGPYGPFLRRVVPHESARIIQAIGIAWIVSIAHAARIFQAIQIIRTMRTIHTVQTIEIALTDLFILGLRSVTNRAIAACDMREGAEMTICAFGGLMRRYMFLMALRTMVTVIPAICVVSSDSVRLRLRTPLLALPLLLRWLR